MSCARLLTALPLCAALLLSACGGGGGDSATDPVAGIDPIETPQGAGDCGLADFQAELLQRINALRAAGASCGAQGTFASTTALTWNTRLQQSALGYSADMQARNYWREDHQTPEGVTFSQRITNAGYTWSTAAENIAAGYATVQAVMDGWRNSPGHCANLMNPNLREVGVACVTGNSANTYPNYWTMDLGAPR